MKKANRGLVKYAGLLALVFGAGAMLTACVSPSPQPQPTTSENQQVKVTWTGVEDIDLSMGDAAPDLLAGVSAKQGEKVLTVKVDEERSDELDTSVAGAFSIYYVAYDGETAIAEELDGEFIRTINVSRGTFVDNAEFNSADARGWGGNGNGNSAMSWRIDDAAGALVVDITASGDEYWQNQVEFNGLEVKANTTYVINIRAKSASPRNIGASLEVPAQGYRCIDTVGVNSVGYTMSNEYQDFKFYYTAEMDFSGVKFGIILGRFNELDEVNPNTVHIDSVSITKAAKQANSTGIVFSGESQVTVKSLAEYQALAPITAADANGNPVELIKEGAAQTVEFNEDLGKAVFGEMWKYVDAEGNLSYFRRQINYSAPAPARAGDYDTLDGDFEFGMKFWVPEENDIVSIEAKKSEKIVEVTSVKAAPSGEANWRAQIQQNNNGGKLEANHAYKMVVVAKIDNVSVQSLSGEFCANAGGNPNAVFPLAFTQADTFETFESQVYQTTQEISGGAYRVGLLLGDYAAAYKLTVASIHIVEVEAETPYIRTTVYETMNGDFNLGDRYWTKEENDIVAITDLEDGTVKVASVKEAPSNEANWRAQLQQNNNGGKLESGHTYKLVVVAKIDNVSVQSLSGEFCANAGGNANAGFALSFSEADTFETFESMPYTPDHDIVEGAYRVGLLLGDYAQAYELIVDSIQIVEIA